MFVNFLFLKNIDKEGRLRFLITTFAVTLSTFILFSVGAINSSLKSQSQIFNSFNAAVDVKSMMASGTLKSTDNVKDETYLTLFYTMLFKDKIISIDKVWRSSEKAPLLPTFSYTPKEGEILVSPALQTLIQNEPILAERFSKNKIIEMDRKNVANPTQLKMIEGVSRKEIEPYRAEKLILLNSEAAKTDNEDRDTFIMNLIMYMGGVGLVFPIMMLIIAATRLGAVQRKKRYAAMSLVGATKRQINRILLIENLVPAILGIVIGTACFFIFRPLLAKTEIFELSFFIESLIIPTNEIIAIIGLTLLLVWFTNFIGTRKIKTSPLSVSFNNDIPKKPRIWGLLPLIAGLGIYGFIFHSGGYTWLREGGNSSFLLILFAFTLITIGLLTSGSWITRKVALIFSKISRKPASLLATKRIALFSRQTFLSVGGMVLALFVGSSILTGVNGISQIISSFEQETPIKDTSIEINISIQREGLATEQSAGLAPEKKVVDQFLKDLKSNQKLNSKIKQQGFSYTPIIKNETEKRPSYKGSIHTILTCQDVAIFYKNNCPGGSKSQTDFLTVKNSFDDQHQVIKNNLVMSAEEIAAIKGYQGKQIQSILIAPKDETDDDLIEEIRNFILENKYLENTGIDLIANVEKQLRLSMSPSHYRDLENLGYFGIALTVIIAAISLTVATVSGLFERKRSFTTLRLSGAEVGFLKKVILLESLLPLFSIALLSTGLGIIVADLSASLLSSKWSTMLPRLDFFIVILICLGLAVLAILAILPMIKRITSLEENRTE